MENSLVITIIILALVILLFIFVSINNSKVDARKRRKILEKIIPLGESIVSTEIATRRDSVIKLDNLLSKALQTYFKNENLCGDNLKLASKIFKKQEYEDLWEVHKIRNKVVHDDYEVTVEEAKEMFQVYKMSITKILK